MNSLSLLRSLKSNKSMIKSALKDVPAMIRYSLLQVKGIHEQAKNYVLAPAVAVGLASQAGAATLTVDNPIYGAVNVTLDVTLTNDDSGVVYDSASTSVISKLAQDVYDLGNHSYSSVQEMINDNTVFSIGIQSGEVDSGWTPSSDATGNILFTHAPFGFNEWNSSESQNDLQFRTQIDYSLLQNDADNSTYNPITDASISINPVTQSNVFTGFDGGFGSVSTSGNVYQVTTAIPEPSSTALIGLGALAGLGYRRKRRFVAAVAVGLASQVGAATLTVDNPIYGAVNVTLDVTLTNNDSGVLYDSASTSVISQLAQDVYNLGNHSYSSVQEMINDNTVFSIGIQSGEVDSGWTPSSDATGNILFTHAPFGFNEWNSSESQNDLQFRTQIDYSLLQNDADNSTYNPITDASIAINPVMQSNVFVGTDASGFNNFSTSGNAYQVTTAVPEPSSTALIGLGALAGLGYRRKKVA